MVSLPFVLVLKAFSPVTVYVNNPSQHCEEPGGRAVSPETGVTLTFIHLREMLWFLTNRLGSILFPSTCIQNSSDMSH